MKSSRDTSKLIIIGVIIFLLVISAIVIFFINRDNKKYSHFGKSNDITIEYAYNQPISSIKGKNDVEPYLDIVKIKVKGEELKKLRKALDDNKFELDKTLESVGVVDTYIVNIGDNEMFYLDQEEAIYTKNSKNFYKININVELFDIISDIVFNYIDNKQEKIKTKEIYFSNDEEEQTYTDSAVIDDILETIRYVKLKSNNVDVTDKDIFIDFKNGITLTTYKYSNIALYTNASKNEKCYVLIYNNSNEYLKTFLSTESIN